jgi:hypothetical protein
VVSTFVSERTKKKIHVLGTNYAQTLADDVGAGALEILRTLHAPDGAVRLLALRRSTNAESNCESPVTTLSSSAGRLARQSSPVPPASPSPTPDAIHAS